MGYSTHHLQLTTGQLTGLKNTRIQRFKILTAADHVWAILTNPDVAERWREVHGKTPDEETLHSIYSGFGALQIEVLKSYLDILPGVADIIAQLRSRGIRFASTTGFESSMMTDVKAAAAAQGYEPEFWVTPDLTGGGRPAPWMIYYAACQLGLYHLHTFVKVGDTKADIGEALNAGTWAVSVVRTGNEIGLSQPELEALSAGDREARFKAAEQRFQAWGAHYIIDSVADLLPVIDQISERIEHGERP